LPLSIILRDILGLARTRKEAKKIVNTKKVQVDGKVQSDDAFPVGIMDVISIPAIPKYYRVLPSHKGLFLHEITQENSTFKLCRVEDKTVLKNGIFQLNLNDGSNILISGDHQQYPTSIKPLSTLKITLPDKQILDIITLKEHDVAIIIGGKNIGKFGKIIKIDQTQNNQRKNVLVTLEDENGVSYKTILNLIFVLGIKTSIISLPED